jgi:hypothetical protein
LEFDELAPENGGVAENPVIFMFSQRGTAPATSKDQFGVKK